MASACVGRVAYDARPVDVNSATLLKPDTVALFGSPPHRLELLGDISGVGLDAVWAEASVVHIWWPA